MDGRAAQLLPGNIFADILQGKHWVPGLGDKPERMLCALPFFHAYGLVMNVDLQPLIGGELVIIPKPDIAP